VPVAAKPEINKARLESLSKGQEPVPAPVPVKPAEPSAAPSPADLKKADEKLSSLLGRPPGK
jgi:hypothetical protein